MYHLGTLFPPVTRLRRLPLSRDQVMLLMAAINEIFLGIDTYLAHSLNGTLRPREYIPILFGPTAGTLLLLAGLLALRRRELATVLASLVFIASLVVGGLGAYFHLRRTLLLGGPAGQRAVLDLFFWAPPVLGPLAFALVGILGLSAAWVEDPPDSGRLRLLARRTLQLPYPKTQAYFYMVSLGILIALISSVLDHARTGFYSPYLWIPVATGTFGMLITAALGAIERPSRSDLLTHTAAMLLLIATGLVGALLHIQANLVAQTIILPERFLRGAPFLAPLLFANMGLLGLTVLLDPAER